MRKLLRFIASLSVAFMLGSLALPPAQAADQGVCTSTGTTSCGCFVNTNDCIWYGGQRYCAVSCSYKWIFFT